MSPIDKETLEGQTLLHEVEGLRERVTGMERLQETNTARLEATEKRISAMEARMTHVDHLLTSMQLDIRRMQRGFDEMKSTHERQMGEQTRQLANMHDVIERIASKLGA